MRQILAFFHSLKPDIRPEIVWRRDPLAHPVIARMTERERADLPFCPDLIASE
jgi:hypothetical protein